MRGECGSGARGLGASRSQSLSTRCEKREKASPCG
uniref:Uncharacterized protein n=1 Tax=Tetraselmis sp. GSL018 TaxID=582737 RepID=A0A061QK77_9CHLO